MLLPKKHLQFAKKIHNATSIMKYLSEFKVLNSYHLYQATV
jgi:hypothetical protein